MRWIFAHIKQKVSGCWWAKSCIFLCCFLFFSCGSASGNLAADNTAALPFTYAGPVNTPVVSGGCARAVTIPSGASTLVTIKTDPASADGHTTRAYRIYLPTAYRSASPLPVVLIFHDYGQDAQAAERETGFSLLAEQQHFIAVYPQGLLDGDRNAPFWASLGPIDYGIDDVLFVSNVLDDVQQKLCVDARHIYATGFANGGGMVNLLACRLSGRIAAFAPVAGSYFTLPGGCRPHRSVPLLELHSADDSVFPYAGTDASQNPAWPLPPIQSWLQAWAQRDGCQSQPTLFLQTSVVTAQRWSPCLGDAAVVHYRLEGIGHDWPLTVVGSSGAALIWTFFQSYSLPLPAATKKNYTSYD